MSTLGWIVTSVVVVSFAISLSVVFASTVRYRRMVKGERPGFIIGRDNLPRDWMDR